MFSDRTVERLRDIIEDARRIATFIDGMTFDDFVASERTLFAVERMLQCITEAVIQIDENDAKTLGSIIPFAKMRGLGNRLRHEYRDLDRGVVFEIAQFEVPSLAIEVRVALGGEIADG